MHVVANRVHLISFCDQRFSRAFNLLQSEAQKMGFLSIVNFTPEDIDNKFRSMNFETLSFDRGAGYWLWKPYIIDRYLSSLSPEDTLLYLDAASIVRREPGYFENLARDGKIHTWVEKSDVALNQLWIDPTVWDKVVGAGVPIGIHFWAGAILSRNTPEFRKVIADWLSLCCKAELLRPDSLPGYVAQGNLIAHRHDQSLLNCVYTLYPKLFQIEHLKGDRNSDPIIAHRFKKVQTIGQLEFSLISQRVYRKVLLRLPIGWRRLIRKSITRFRKPYSTRSERERHGRLTE